MTWNGGDQEHPAQVVALAQFAETMDPRTPDAAALLSDAAALLCVECGLPLTTLFERMEATHKVFAEARPFVLAGGRRRQ